MLKTIEKCQRFFVFFCIFLQTKFQAKILVPKTKRNNDENKQKKIKN